MTVNVKNSAEEMFRYEMAEVNLPEQMKPHITRVEQHDQRDEHAVAPPCPHRGGNPGSGQ